MPANGNLVSFFPKDAASLENKKALEIYKVIMIFTCCVLAIVLVLFLICILKNTDSLAVPTTSSSVNLNEAYLSCEDGSIGAQNGNGLLINLPFEKPPSYLEVLQEIGSPPPIYSDDQHTNANSDVQNQIASSAIRLQSELVLDCNQWLEQANSERSCLETRLAIELRRSELRRLSRNLERFNFPNILSRCHSSPIIRNSLLLKNQHLIDILSSSQDTSPANRTSQSTPTQVSGVNLVVNRTNLPDDQSSASTSQT